LAGIVVSLLRYYFGGRRGMIVLTVAALGAGVFFNWGWLVAAGIAPLLLALAPCAAMCALGLCMNKAGAKACSTESKPGDQGAGANPASTSADSGARHAASERVGKGVSEP
jgi:hypothetical protein